MRPVFVGVSIALLIQIVTGYDLRDWQWWAFAVPMNVIATANRYWT